MNTVHSVHTSGSVFARSGRILFDAIGGFPRRFKERRELNRLLNMEDYMLRDIGVSRGTIQQGASRSLWHD